MKTLLHAILALVLAQMAPMSAHAEVSGNGPRELRAPALESIAAVVNNESRAGHIPGAVVLIGSRSRVVYRRAFGYRALKPKKSRMTVDAIFDLASLTKVVATTTAVMQLVDLGEIDLDAPVAKYWPAFSANGKEAITVRAALTHYSGLGPDLDLDHDWSGYSAAMEMIAAQRPLYPPGTRFLYSDINFEILGELVRRVSGEPLDVYCHKHIFMPLGMRDTSFRPRASKRRRIAPTEYIHGTLRWGDVHDPTAFRMGGVAGHAGLFSTADDLAIFAQMMLDGGRAKGVRILSASTAEKMTMPDSPSDGTTMRGLGWDLGPPLAANRDELLPIGSYGHSGFTGTLIWIDPVSRTYVIVLTNRVHPNGRGTSEPLRTRILAVVSEALGRVSQRQVLASRPGLATYYENLKKGSPIYHPKVAVGADVLEAEGFAPIRGLRIGLITNQSGIDSKGNRLIDVLRSAPRVKLAAIFTPEHGLYGLADQKVASGIDPATGLPIFSLYGDVMRPTDLMLDDIDALVFDVQDCGARFYTYATTMAYAMEAAAKKGIAFYVLDRPDPISAAVVQGPLMDRNLKSFVGYFPLPIRHGMTVGEMAEMFNAENRIGADLHVIRMRGYRRSEWYDQTGLPWVPLSPNLRTLDEVALYPGVALVEGANLSVGRGTDAPFGLVGAPWIDGRKLAAYLSSRNIAGVRFEPAHFTPTANRYKGEACDGVRIILTDRLSLNAPALGIELASALHRLFPATFELNKTLPLIGSRRVLQAVNEGEDAQSIAQQWQVPLGRFRELRAKYVLY